MAKIAQPCGDLSGDLGLGPADKADLATQQRCRHAVRRRTRSAERGSFVSVLHGPQRADDLSRTAPVRLRDRALQSEQVRSPAPVRDGEPASPADQCRHNFGGILVLR